VQEKDRRFRIGGVRRNSNDSEARQDVAHRFILAGPLPAR
jgi:hypothetical protein